MRDVDVAAVLAFNDAINARDEFALGLMMAPGHRFIDSAGSVVNGKEACLEAWRGFFDSFPDYRNIFDEWTSTSPGLVEIRGRSECSVAELDGPARWRAVVSDGLVLEWRVSSA